MFFRWGGKGGYCLPICHTQFFNLTYHCKTELNHVEKIALSEIQALLPREHL